MQEFKTIQAVQQDFVDKLRGLDEEGLLLNKSEIVKQLEKLALFDMAAQVATMEPGRVDKSMLYRLHSLFDKNFYRGFRLFPLQKETLVYKPGELFEREILFMLKHERDNIPVKATLRDITLSADITRIPSGASSGALDTPAVLCEVLSCKYQRESGETLVQVFISIDENGFHHAGEIDIHLTAWTRDKKLASTDIRVRVEQSPAFTQEDIATAIPFVEYTEIHDPEPLPIFPVENAVNVASTKRIFDVTYPSGREVPKVFVSNNAFFPQNVGPERTTLVFQKREESEMRFDAQNATGDNILLDEAYVWVVWLDRTLCFQVDYTGKKEANMRQKRRKARR